MVSMNKFKVLTIVVICMFVFVIAAIYTNTKDATQGKLDIKNQAAKEQIDDKGSVSNDENNATRDDVSSLEVSTQIELLNKRIDELNERVAGQNQAASEGTGLKCKIYGSMTANGIEQLSPEAAVQEAKANDNDIVITCSF